jgi:hypothetical protein
VGHYIAERLTVPFNSALERTAGSRALAAAAQSDRSADNTQ